jgi:DNA-directed RNA polymerase subunit RPC12/RpoP
MIKFDKKAMQKFNQIPDDIKSKILSNVYCSNCKEMVKIVDFEASMDEDDLVLRGKCENCSGKIVRLIEG